jgi:hypothetical protein
MLLWLEFWAIFRSPVIFKPGLLCAFFAAAGRGTSWRDDGDVSYRVEEREGNTIEDDEDREPIS